MTGKQLFEHYQAEGSGNPGSDASYYAGILFQSLLIMGEQKTYELLEEAERTGKKLDLNYPIAASQGPSTPDQVILV